MITDHKPLCLIFNTHRQGYQKLMFSESSVKELGNCSRPLRTNAINNHVVVVQNPESMFSAAKLNQ